MSSFPLFAVTRHPTSFVAIVRQGKQIDRGIDE